MRFRTPQVRKVHVIVNCTMDIKGVLDLYYREHTTARGSTHTHTDIHGTGIYSLYYEHVLQLEAVIQPIYN